MIAWAFHSAAALSGGDGGRPVAALTAAERERFERLPVAKRRQDWLSGRLAAKAAIGAVVVSADGPTLAPRQIQVDSTEDGVPVAKILAEVPPQVGNVSLSISHSQGVGVAAATSLSDTWLGIDLELIEPRGQPLLDDFFAEEERVLVACAEPAEKMALLTGIWAGKEAVLKAVRRGLSLDSRRVRCLLAPPGPRWQPFSIQVPSGWLTAATYGAGRERELWGACRRVGRFVVAVSALAPSGVAPQLSDSPVNPPRAGIAAEMNHV